MSKKIDGIVFEKMMRNARNLLVQYEDEVNSLNVFPVADGDTGTNMRLTVENGLKTAKTNANLGLYLKGLSDGMLLGARGNSGVILSQLFAGFAQALVRYNTANAGDIRNALIRAYKMAYASVIHPVEGTVLTAAREGVEHIKNSMDRNTTVEALYAMYIAEMKKTLKETPEMLDVLKEAGVVDSGAYGYIILTEGMLKYLYGEEIAGEVQKETAAPAAAMQIPDAEALKSFDGTTPFEDGYCMEFLLQLMKNREYAQDFRLNGFIRDLEDCGNSIVAVQSGTIIKVHIHTKRPAKIIMLAQNYGEFVAFKLENMQLQHNEHIKKLEKRKKSEKHVPVSMIAVADGEGFSDLYAQLNIEFVLDGGATMNTPAEEFVDAINAANADRIVIFPNNKNIISAAEQAVKLTGAENVQVLPSENMMECYYAAASDIADSDDVDRRVNLMREGLESASTMMTAKAGKEYTKNGIAVHTGDDVAIIDDEIVYSSGDFLETIREGLKKTVDLDEKSALFAMRGLDTPEEEEEALQEMIETEFPDLELTVENGGQHVYRWIFGLI